MRRWGIRGRRGPGGSLCLLPWTNLSVDVDGTARPCCKFAHVDEVGGRPLHGLADTGLEGTWNSPGMQELRRRFLAGERPEACASCWAEEAAGVPSFRQVFLRDRGMSADVDVTDLTPPQPHGLDLKLSNTCNLACRICGPVASSRWLTEELAAAPPPRRPGSFVARLADDRRYLAANKLTDDPAARARLEAWAPEVEHLELTGGEPMLSKESGDVLEILALHGRPERTTLQITTNATTIDERITRHLGAFRRVTISLSVDDMGARLEYQRHPARWEEVEANIRRYGDLVGRSCHVYLNATVSLFSAWHLPDYLAWWADEIAPLGIRFHPNLLHDPVEQCAQQLPEPLKERMAERWHGHRAWRSGRTRQPLEEVLGFVQQVRADPARWSAFLARTDEVDRRRGQSFAATYPELVAEARDLGLWPRVSTPRG